MMFRVMVQPNPNTVADKWDRQYPPTELSEAPRHREIGQKLRALRNPTAEQIEEIIGNRSWTRICCSNCSTEAERLVVFGSDENVALCASCLRGALEIVGR